MFRNNISASSARRHTCLTFAKLKALDCRAILLERNLEENVRVLEKALLEADDQELAALEVFLYHEAYVLGVTQVKSRVDFIQDVEGSRLVFQ